LKVKEGNKQLNESDTQTKKLRYYHRFWRFDNIIRFITISIVFFLLIVAICSLDESIRTRKDTLLPIVIVIDQDAGSFICENCGSGTTHRFKVNISDSKKKYENKKILRVGDTCRVVYHKEFDDDIYAKQTPEMKLIITYYDVFDRKIQTIYNLIKLERPDGKYQLLVDFTSASLKLPK
jgi:hypothetical protein